MTPCPSQHPKPLKPSRGRRQSSVVVPIAIPAIHLSYPSSDGTPSQIDVDNISYAYFTKYTIISTQTTYTNYYTSMSNPLTTSVTNQHLSQDTRASPPPSNHFFHLAHASGTNFLQISKTPSLLTLSNRSSEQDLELTLTITVYVQVFKVVGYRD